MESRKIFIKIYNHLKELVKNISFDSRISEIENETQDMKSIGKNY